MDKSKLILNSIQIVIAIGLLNVWLLRNKKSTDYRGGNALTLKQEFEIYGLPFWFYYLIGFLKISSALLLIAGIWKPILVIPVASLVSILMLGALAMHIKVKDPIKKSLPALCILLLNAALILGAMNKF
jgi:hypothetical protein